MPSERLNPLAKAGGFGCYAWIVTDVRKFRIVFCRRVGIEAKRRLDVMWHQWRYSSERTKILSNT